MERLDIVVVGAGWYGLGAAKQYHCQHPKHSIAVLDSGSSIGGVWSVDRIYPKMKSNNLHGTFEYPDFPMNHEELGLQPDEHIPGEMVHHYLESYAEHFGILNHVRLNIKVVSATHKPEGGWTIRIRRLYSIDEDEALEGEIFTKRLVVATGLTSNPFLPHIKGQEIFRRPLFHSKHLAVNAEDMDALRRITVFGGSKSAWDAAYMYASSGVQVDWVIRATGPGTCWMSPPYVTPFKRWLEKLAHTRMITWFSPCAWDADSGYSTIRSFYRTTAAGRAIADRFFNVMSNNIMNLAGFDKDPETRKLRPTTELLFAGCRFGILNYDTDILELVRNGTIKVHVADISHLSPGKVHLNDEEKTVIQTDAMLCATGWKYSPPFKFLPEGIEKKIGLCYVPSETDGALSANEALAAQRGLIELVDAEISKHFPRLNVPPKHNPDYVSITDTEAFSVRKGDEGVPTLPYTLSMLYRFIVPGTSELLRTKDIAFAGMVSNLSNAVCAHVQGLWISAYFDGRLVRDPGSAVTISERDFTEKSSSAMTLDEVQYETVLHNRFGKWRYPNNPGCNYPDFMLEGVSYMDTLLADLGLKVFRKENWVKEMFEPYGVEDYRDINDEWQAKFSKKSA